MREIKPQTDEIMECGGCSKNKEPKKYYPRMRLEHKFFPEVKNWKVGKEYDLKLKVKMTGLSISKFQNDSEFDIIGIDSDMSEEDKE